jgi:predicted ester cyclase
MRSTQFAHMPPAGDGLRELKNKGAVAACDNQVFREKNIDYLDELYVTDYVDYDIFPGQPPGLDGFKESFKWYLEAFPDLHTIVDLIVAEGDMVVVQGFFEGTQVGPFLGIDASGLHVLSRRSEAMRFNDEGRAVERWGVGAELNFLQAMGVIPTLDVPKAQLARAESLANVFSREFFSNLNPAAIAELVDKRGRADSKAMLALFQVASAVQDVEVKLGEQGSAGPRAATIRAEISGAHAGRGLPEHADQARVTAQLELSVRVANGKIVDIWADVDFKRERPPEQSQQPA